MDKEKLQQLTRKASLTFDAAYPEIAFKTALMLGKRRIYEKTIQEALAAHKRLKIPATREDVIKALEKQIPDLRQILGEVH